LKIFKKFADDYYVSLYSEPGSVVVINNLTLADKLFYEDDLGQIVLGTIHYSPSRRAFLGEIVGDYSIVDIEEYCYEEETCGKLQKSFEKAAKKYLKSKLEDREEML